MSQVIVVNNSLKIANNLCDILETRGITVIKAGIGSSKPDFFGIDLVGYQAETIVCSDIFEKEIGGSSKLVSIARQAKLTKIIVISDHGNGETMINEDGSPNTAHTTNPVPVILVDKDFTAIKNGVLGDIAPTILKLMSVDIPKKMTGNPLV